MHIAGTSLLYTKAIYLNFNELLDICNCTTIQTRIYVHGIFAITYNLCFIQCEHAATGELEAPLLGIIITMTIFLDHMQFIILEHTCPDSCVLVHPH